MNTVPSLLPHRPPECEVMIARPLGLFGRWPQASASGDLLPSDVLWAPSKPLVSFKVVLKGDIETYKGYILSAGLWEFLWAPSTVPY